MTDDEALLALATGSGSERDGALALLYDRYAARLVSLLEKRYRFDPECAESGMMDAFMELRGEAEKLLMASTRVWAWLIDRAGSRAVDETRRFSLVLSNVPASVKETMTREDLPECLADISSMDTAEGKELKALVLEVIASLDEPERGIFLHDCVWKFDLLTAEEGAAVDSQLLTNLEGIYGPDALKKRRQRLYAGDKLRRLLKGVLRE